MEQTSDQMTETLHPTILVIDHDKMMDHPNYFQQCYQMIAAQHGLCAYRAKERYWRLYNEGKDWTKS